MAIDYSIDKFNDPIVRCSDCQTLIFRGELQQIGCCPKCGNRRVKNVLVCSEAEMADLMSKNVDPDFLALFEGVA